MLYSYLGGLLVGGAAAVLLVANGKIAGISGMLGNLTTDRAWWRLAFLVGTVLGAALLLGSQFAAVAPSVSTAKILVAAALVGVGTRLANGCTSGHGICGVGRLSKRSAAATATFVGSGIGTATLLGVL